MRLIQGECRASCKRIYKENGKEESIETNPVLPRISFTQSTGQVR